MKKSICIIFSIMAAAMLMGGCEKNDTESDAQQQKIDSVASHDYSIHEEMPTPYETINDIQNFTEATEDQTYNMDQDYQYYYKKIYAGSSDIAEAENTIFFYETNQNSSYIKMIDKETKTIQNFCNKPECSHNTETCNAYFKNIRGMFYYNGYIYIMLQEYFTNENTWDEVELNLYRVSIETQEREKVKNIAASLTENGIESYSLAYIQHRGYLYYIYDIGTGGNSEIFYNNGSNSLYRINIEDADEKECIANMDRTGGLIVPFLHLQATGSYIYYMLPDEIGMGEIYRFNTETLKNEALNLGTIATENFIVWDGDVYYKKDWTETLIYRWSGQTGTEELYIDTMVSGYEKSSDFYVGTDYMYISCYDDEYPVLGCHQFTVFDKEGSMVTELKLPVENTVDYGGKDIFVSYKSENSQSGALYILDINDISKKGEKIFSKIELSMLK